jgi:outer membrane protein assembly factor BamB
MKKLLLITLAAVLAVACSKDNVEPPAPLPDISKPQLEVNDLWTRGISGNNVAKRVNLAPASDGTNVYVAANSGSVYALSLEDGSILWRTRMVHELLGAGPAVKDGLVVVVTSSGLVVAMQPSDGKILWKSDVNGESLAIPAIGSGTVIVRTTDGRLVALAADSGKQRWKTNYEVPRLSLRGACNPVIIDRMVLDGLDDGRLVALNLDDGSQLWQATVGTPKGSNELARLADVDGPLAVTSDDVYAVGYRGQAAAITRSNGQIFWSRDLDSYTGVSVDDNNVYISDVNGTVWALDKSNGAPLWTQPKLHARSLTLPVPFGDALVAGDLQGYIHFISKKDGSFMARDKLGNDPITAPPLVVGDVLVVQSNDGKIGAYTVQPTAK